MNIFEKYKYKKLFDGCDYNLAAEVIRESFAKTIERNGTMSGKLIEEFLSNPCLENAIKLVGHDQMMIFYFNECKENGLYKRQRKTKLETAATAEINLNGSLSKANPQESPRTNAEASSVSSDPLLPFDPNKTKFPNVISTLSYDYNEISNQIKEFKSQARNGKDAHKYQELIKTYEEALMEFEAAIKVLRHHRKV